MSISIEEFWKLLSESRLVSEGRCHALTSQFAQVKGAATQANARALAEWLISQNVLSRYQAKLLLAGRAGPFHFGEYQVYGRWSDGRFRAIHVPTKHPVFLEFVAPGNLVAASGWDRLAASIEAHNALRAPHLTECFEFVDLGTQKFEVLEHLQGESLARRLQTTGPLPCPAASELVRDLANGLAALHGAGLVHGNVTADCAWRDKSGTTKLMRSPLVIARPRDWTADDEDGQLAKLAAYAAPELVSAATVPDVSTDIYALGCLFYQLLSGSVPFPAAGVSHKLAQHAAQPIPRLARATVSDELFQLISQMMAKRRDDRLLSASAVAQRIASVTGIPDQATESSTGDPTREAYLTHLAQRDSAVPRTGAAHTTAPASVSADPQSTPSTAAVAIAPATGPTNAAASSSQLRDRRRRDHTTMYVLLACGAAALLLLVAVLPALQNGNGTNKAPTESVSTDHGDARPVETSETDLPEDGGASPPASMDVNGTAVTLVDDDGHTLWASPTAGKPIELRYAPRGAQFFIWVRPAELLAHEEGRRTLQALGPVFAARRSSWETATKVRLEEIDRLLLAFLPRNNQRPLVTATVGLREPLDWVARWGNLQPERSAEGDFYEVAGRGFFLPANEEQHLFITGPAEIIAELAGDGGAPPSLRLDAEKLRQLSDSDRHVTILGVPNFLFRDGRKLFADSYERLVPALETFLADDIQAAMFSSHVTDDQGVYGELRLRSRLETSPTKLSERMRDHVRQLPGRAESFIGSLTHLDAYWRRVALRLDNMLDFFQNQTRVGVESDHAVLNFSLPSAASHNLVLAAELALSASSGSGPAASTVPNRPAVRTMQDVLGYKLNLSIPQQSLEFSMRDLAADVNGSIANLPFEFRIEIVGPDLQGEGITRNQQIRNFYLQNRTVAELLTALVMTANPVTTVQAPTELDQKLVWVVEQDTEASNQEIILITTRKAAEKKGYSLPQVFVNK